MDGWTHGQTEKQQTEVRWPVAGFPLLLRNCEQKNKNKNANDNKEIKITVKQKLHMQSEKIKNEMTAKGGENNSINDCCENKKSIKSATHATRCCCISPGRLSRHCVCRKCRWLCWTAVELRLEAVQPAGRSYNR